MRFLHVLFLRIVMVSSILTMLLLTIPTAWSYVYFDYTSFGSGTTIYGVAVTSPPPPPYAFVYIVPYPYRDSGGDGVLSVYDSAKGSIGYGSTTVTAIADALGTVGAFVSVNWDSATLSGGLGWAYSKFYDTYTVVSVNALPKGTPVSISLVWGISGVFFFILPDEKEPVLLLTPGENPAGAQLQIWLWWRPPGYLPLARRLYINTWVSSEYTEVDEQGTIDLSSEFSIMTGRPLTVGDSFIVEAVLYVYLGNPAWPPRPTGIFTCNFLETGSLSLSSGTPGASITSLAQQAARPPGPVPEFGLSSVLIASVLAALYFLRSRPRRIVSQG